MYAWTAFLCRRHLGWLAVDAMPVFKLASERDAQRRTVLNTSLLIFSGDVFVYLCRAFIFGGHRIASSGPESLAFNKLTSI